MTDNLPPASGFGAKACVIGNKAGVCTIGSVFLLFRVDHVGMATVRNWPVSVECRHSDSVGVADNVPESGNPGVFAGNTDMTLTDLF